MTPTPQPNDRHEDVAAQDHAWLKENALLLVEHHKHHCDGGCGVLVLGIWQLLKLAGFELTDDEKARLM